MTLLFGGRTPDRLVVAGRDADAAVMRGVRVFARGNAPTVTSFTVSPATARQGVSATLNLAWTLGGDPATSVTVDQVLADGTRTRVPNTTPTSVTGWAAPAQDATYILTATNALGSASARAGFVRTVPASINYFRVRAGSRQIYQGPVIGGGFFERWTLEWSVPGKPRPHLRLDHSLSEHVGDPNRATDAAGLGSIVVQRRIPPSAAAVSEVFTLSAGPTLTATATVNWASGGGG